MRVFVWDACLHVEVLCTRILRARWAETSTDKEWTARSRARFSAPALNHVQLTPQAGTYVPAAWKRSAGCSCLCIQLVCARHVCSRQTDVDRMNILLNTEERNFVLRPIAHPTSHRKSAAAHP